MKQLLIVFSLLTIFIDIKAQVNPGTTVFEGRTVNIYPYRVNSSNYSTDNRWLQISENIDIPYCPLSLPDGEYVAFYPGDNHYDKFLNVIYLKGDTDNIAINFSIKNGKKEGAAVWFTTNIKHKKIFQQGHYKEDQKDGEWVYNIENISKTFHYKNGLLDGDLVSIDKIKHKNKSYHFTNGLLNGNFIVIDTKYHDRSELGFVNGNISGSFYCLKHNVCPEDIRILGGYSKERKSYKTVEVRGNLFYNLKL